MARFIPPKVRRARLKQDKATLRWLGRKGGLKKQSNRTSREMRRKAIMEMGMREMRYQALEHISDPNREGTEYPGGVITSP